MYIHRHWSDRFTMVCLINGVWCPYWNVNYQSDIFADQLELNDHISWLWKCRIKHVAFARELKIICLVTFMNRVIQYPLKCHDSNLNKTINSHKKTNILIFMFNLFACVGIDLHSSFWFSPKIWLFRFWIKSASESTHIHTLRSVMLVVIIRRQPCGNFWPTISQIWNKNVWLPLVPVLGQ